jgi:hypothetical protein
MMFLDPLVLACATRTTPSISGSVEKNVRRHLLYQSVPAGKTMRRMARSTSKCADSGGMLFSRSWRSTRGLRRR